MYDIIKSYIQITKSYVRFDFFFKVAPIRRRSLWLVSIQKFKKYVKLCTRVDCIITVVSLASYLST